MVCLNYWRSTEGLTLGDNSLDRCDLYKEVAPGKPGADFTAKIRNGRPYRYMRPQRVGFFSRFVIIITLFTLVLKYYYALREISQ